MKQNRMILAFSFSLIALFSSLGQSLQAQTPTKSLNRIVIDAGHGGTDPGSKGKYSTEAAVSLAIAMKLEDFIKIFQMLLQKMLKLPVLLKS